MLVGVDEFVANRLLHCFEPSSLKGLLGEPNRAIARTIRRAHAMLPLHTRASLEGHPAEVNMVSGERPLVTENNLVCVLPRAFGEVMRITEVTSHRHMPLQAVRKQSCLGCISLSGRNAWYTSIVDSLDSDIPCGVSPDSNERLRAFNENTLSTR